MRLIFTILLMATLYCSPAYAQDELTIRTADELAAQANIEFFEPISMYAKGEYDIRQLPFDTSYIFDTSFVNTAFEVIGKVNEWYVITTEDGYAFMKIEHLQEELIEEYSDDDLYVLAHLLAGEAQYCSDKEQRYVGSVVLNRVSHPNFPESIKSVVFQRGQYACTKDGNYYREPTDRNWENARWLLENGSILPGDVVWQSKGRQGKRLYLKTRWHSYCY